MLILFGFAWRGVIEHADSLNETERGAGSNGSLRGCVICKLN